MVWFDGIDICQYVAMLCYSYFVNIVSIKVRCLNLQKMIND